MTIAIHTEGLTKHYGDVKALVDLDLDVAAGEIFGFLGPNGAGKTTAIRTLMDEIRATAGSATIVDLDTHRDSVAIRRHVGYVPGDLAMYPNLTGKDTITYFSNLRGGVEWPHVDELAERLDADLSKKVGDLSTGNRQKVGLILAFMNRPQVLIMDEPSSGLDPLVQREFQLLLREFVTDGGAVFLSSHTLSEVQRVADQGRNHPPRPSDRPRDRLRASLQGDQEGRSVLRWPGRRRRLRVHRWCQGCRSEEPSHQPELRWTCRDTPAGGVGHVHTHRHHHTRGRSRGDLPHLLPRRGVRLRCSPTYSPRPRGTAGSAG